MCGSPWRQECADFLERFHPNGTAAGMRFKKRANGTGRGCSKEANVLQKMWAPLRTPTMVPEVGLEPTRYRYQRILSFCLRSESVGLHRYRVESNAHHQITKLPDFRAFPPKPQDAA